MWSIQIKRERVLWVCIKWYAGLQKDCFTNKPNREGRRGRGKQTGSRELG
jgi:hypothetical protein